MLETAPLLDETTLIALRRLAQAVCKPCSAIPAFELVQLANGTKVSPGITIDFTAMRDMGALMVVVHVPAPLSGGQGLPGLTRRENEIAALVSAGFSNKQIARQLCITLATVKYHVHRILTKMQLPNRAALAVIYRCRASTTPMSYPRSSDIVNYHGDGA